ncbi:MAG: hypothetical protein M9887_11890 [Chitinophagales bacterium]|nr:hypothetical protein [Chitinophagales bacterium]
MLQSLSNSYYVLLILTLLVATVFKFQGTVVILFATIIMSVLKFYLVGFQFMELNQAHTFWKVLLIVYGFVIGSIWIILLG